MDCRSLRPAETAAVLTRPASLSRRGLRPWSGRLPPTCQITQSSNCQVGRDLPPAVPPHLHSLFGKVQPHARPCRLAVHLGATRAAGLGVDRPLGSGRHGAQARPARLRSPTGCISLRRCHRRSWPFRLRYSRPESPPISVGSWERWTRRGDNPRPTACCPRQ